MKLCIICEIAGFCINWLTIAASGIALNILSRSGRPSPPSPVGACGLVSLVGFDLVVLVWAPPPVRFIQSVQLIKTSN
jgi:hypothetical protein